MVYQTDLDIPDVKGVHTPGMFNPSPPQVMHLDLNSCFASVEQQANPLLRDRPLAVVHSDAPYGCILAPSIEAKLWGIKTGMTLAQGKQLCPWLIARVADPPKYRQIHAQLANLLQDYSPHVIPKSIDEFVLTVPIPKGSDLEGLSHEIKSRIKSEIGAWLRVSIGVSTNQILAKLASGLHKPDGFDVIDSSNFLQIYSSIPLTDFCGINVHNEARLHRVGIFTPIQFYRASLLTLKSAFKSVLGHSWYTRLQGYEIDDVQFRRQSFGQSYVLPQPMEFIQWRPILAKLVSKAARRLRGAGFSASGVHLALRFNDGSSWHAGHNTPNLLFDDVSLFRSALNLYLQSYEPCKKVKKVAFTCYGLDQDSGQLNCLVDLAKQKSLVSALDTLNDKWGNYSVTYGSMLGTEDHVKDAIAFGR
ncbi:MAG: hypothetical protein ACD_40C00145G0011 [uncultured bacterium]|nr:MAG: hypothetical protein ACD_40C00145G0011 [uncultured bacterium]